ncbi:polyhydroxyalkanoic acid system family protein [Piscinibacter sp.]|uniref:polyhydroxyalkanoic acid system family protein n=1 Tax=Piscinibacter sp. TaxID=1903157 RepID=UPI002CB0F51E|nr:polyhydroxyalkanoic acid system family protein [Albitalea sp.]HUG26266.1 polyhydroxyalkanoic acid system family protein [Albitalea sp.]
MATPISIPHQLGRAEARRRIASGQRRHQGDRLTFGVTAIGQTVAGVIDVLDAAVTIEIQLPGVLGMIASGIKDRLQKVGQLLLEKK